MSNAASGVQRRLAIMMPMAWSMTDRDASAERSWSVRVVSSKRRIAAVRAMVACPAIRLASCRSDSVKAWGVVA